MAFSGTVSQTVFTTRKVVDSAIRRTKLRAQQITTEHLTVANDQLYLLLSELANKGAPLWCIQKCVLPLYAGSSEVATYAGTVDILNANIRQTTQLSGTVTTTSTSYTLDIGATTAVTVVGIEWSGSSTTIAIQSSPDGSTWTTLQSETPSAQAGDRTWFDLNATANTRYIRVVASTGVLNFTSVYFGNNPLEIPLGRINRDQYTSLPNKSLESERPLQYWLDRQALSPVIRVWPVPNTTAENRQIVAWVHRHIMDVGALSQQIEVPQRWLEAITAGLAYRVGREFPETDEAVLARLGGEAAVALAVAEDEERDNSPITFAPNIAPYTR